MMFGFDWDRLPNRDLFEYLVHRTCLSNLQANSASSLKSETLMWTDLLSILVWTWVHVNDFRSFADDQGLATIKSSCW